MISLPLSGFGDRLSLRVQRLFAPRNRSAKNHEIAVAVAVHVDVVDILSSQ